MMAMKAEGRSGFCYGIECTARAIVFNHGDEVRNPDLRSILLTLGWGLYLRMRFII